MNPSAKGVNKGNKKDISRLIMPFRLFPVEGGGNELAGKELQRG